VTDAAIDRSPCLSILPTTSFPLALNPPVARAQVSVFAHFRFHVRARARSVPRRSNGPVGCVPSRGCGRGCQVRGPRCGSRTEIPKAGQRGRCAAAAAEPGHTPAEGARARGALPLERERRSSSQRNSAIGSRASGPRRGRAGAAAARQVGPAADSSQHTRTARGGQGRTARRGLAVARSTLARRRKGGQEQARRASCLDGRATRQRCPDLVAGHPLACRGGPWLRAPTGHVARRGPWLRA